MQAAFDEVTRAQAGVRARENDAKQRADRQVRQAHAQANQTRKMALAYQQEQIALARADANSFDKRLQEFQRAGKDNPNYLKGIWWQEIGRIFARLKEQGQLDLLDHHLNRNGLDLTTWIATPDKKK